MAPSDRDSHDEALDRDERLVEFVRHFRGCEQLHIETGQLLHELSAAVLAGDLVSARALANKAKAFLDAAAAEDEADY